MWWSHNHSLAAALRIHYCVFIDYITYLLISLIIYYFYSDEDIAIRCKGADVVGTVTYKVCSVLDNFSVSDVKVLIDSLCTC